MKGEKEKEKEIDGEREEREIVRQKARERKNSENIRQVRKMFVVRSA